VVSMGTPRFGTSPLVVLYPEFVGGAKEKAAAQVLVQGNRILVASASRR